MKNQQTKQRREAENFFNDICVSRLDTVHGHITQTGQWLLLDAIIQDRSVLMNDKNHLAWQLLIYDLLSRLT